MKLTKFISVKTLSLPATKICYQTSTPLRNCSALSDSPNASLNRIVFERYMAIPLPECKAQACYIWIDGSGINMRCKSRTLDYVPSSHNEVPVWTFDGSSTGQGIESKSDCYLVPVAMYKDPLLRGNSKLVLCETLDSENRPTTSNHRQKCAEALQKAYDQEVLVGFEQEFILYGPDRRPFGWPKNGEPSFEVANYCGLGANNVMGRAILDAFSRSCLYCGIDLYGTNGEVMPSQWEFQTGPTGNLKAGDDLWMARFLLCKVAEDFGVAISFEPKPFPHMAGSGLHTNFSTRDMRDEGGIKYIEEAIKKLEKAHKAHLAVYDINGGKDNIKRLTGKDETCHIDEFKIGVMDRGASIRISLLVSQKKKGFFEDRRPASNADPYQVINILVNTILL